MSNLMISICSVTNWIVYFSSTCSSRRKTRISTFSVKIHFQSVRDNPWLKWWTIWPKISTSKNSEKSSKNGKITFNASSNAEKFTNPLVWLRASRRLLSIDRKSTIIFARLYPLIHSSRGKRWLRSTKERRYQVNSPQRKPQLSKLKNSRSLWPLKKPPKPSKTTNKRNVTSKSPKTTSRFKLSEQMWPMWISMSYLRTNCQMTPLNLAHM